MTFRSPQSRAPRLLALAAILFSSVGVPFAAAGAEAQAQPQERSLSSVVAADKVAESKGLLFLGNSLTERSDFAAAEIAYRQVLNSPDFKPADKKDALVGIGKMYRRAGLFTKAAAINEKFLKEFPDDVRAPDVLLDQGRVLRSMGAYKMAINRFYSVIDSTLKLQTENFYHYQQLAKTAQFEIAETHFASGNYVEAGKFFARLRLLDLAPADRARAHFKSAYSLQLAGDLEGAVTTLRAYLEQWPQEENVPEARYLLATTLLQLKRPDESLAATLALLRGQEANSAADPKQWAYWQRRTGNQLANEFFQNGDTANALAIYRGLSALTSDAAWRLPVTYQIGLCYERLRRLDLARAAYQSILDGMPPAPPARDGAPAPDPSPDMKELARMASWRMEHLEWNDRTELELTKFFATGSLSAPTTHKPVTTNDTDASAAAAPGAVQ
jgi:tetratricopeptide (TPR) repeat protein